MLAIVFSFLKGPLGGWAVAGAIALAGFGAFEVQALRIDAANGRTATAIAERDKAVDANAGFVARLESVTSDLAAAKAKAADASAALADQKVDIAAKTVTSTREIDRNVTPADKARVTPSLRSALAELRRQYPASRQGSAPGGAADAPGGSPAPLR